RRLVPREFVKVSLNNDGSLFLTHGDPSAVNDPPQAIYVCRTMSHPHADQDREGDTDREGPTCKLFARPLRRPQSAFWRGWRTSCGGAGRRRHQRIEPDVHQLLVVPGSTLTLPEGRPRSEK